MAHEIYWIVRERRNYVSSLGIEKKKENKVSDKNRSKRIQLKQGFRLRERERECVWLS